MPTMTDYVLVDKGYLLFYRYHATVRWMSFQKEIDSSEESIKQYFRTHLISMLDKWKRKYKNATFVFCKDERHNEVWRKQIYPEYKATRGVATETIRDIQGILKDVVATYGRVVFGLGLEADDVAYLIVRKLRSEPATQTAKIVILTSDHDYLQMVDEHITILDGAGKPISGTGNAEVDLWKKILMGDVSDNIPPVCKGCGKKTAETLARDENKRIEYIQKNNCAQQVERNRTLISMACIPSHLVSGFYESLVW